MSEYFFERMQPTKADQADNQTLLLDISRQQQSLHQHRQHLHMLAEDIHSAVYHQLNSIVQLQQLEQMQHEEEPHSKTKDDMVNSKIQFLSVMNQTAEIFSTYHCKVQQQMEITHKKAQIEVEINRLKIDKSTLFQEIRLLGQQWKEQRKKSLGAKSCKKAEDRLMERGGRYNLCKVIGKFMEDLKETLAATWLAEALDSMLKYGTTLEDLRLGIGQLRSKKELVNNFTLYLQTFYSPNIVKELSEAIDKLVINYEQSRNQADRRLMQHIQNNLASLEKISKMMNERSSKAMDFKIDVQVLAQEIKVMEKQLSSLQQQVSQTIHKEAEVLAGQYARFNRYNHDCTQYFQTQLQDKYRYFIASHANRARDIQNISKRIQYYSSRIQQCQDQMLCLQQEANQIKEQNQNKVNTIRQSLAVLKESKCSNMASRQESRLRPERRKKQQQKQRFIARKVFNIGSAQKRSAQMPKNQNLKECEVKVTSKYLIMQPIGDQVLAVCQKIELGHIRNYEIHRQKNLLKIDYGGCNLSLHFLTLNLTSFQKKLSSLIGPKFQHN